MTYEIIKNYPQRFKALTSYDVKRFNELLIFLKSCLTIILKLIPSTVK